jgi:hypothetical protein
MVEKAVALGPSKPKKSHFDTHYRSGGIGARLRLGQSGEHLEFLRFVDQEENGKNG